MFYLKLKTVFPSAESILKVTELPAQFNSQKYNIKDRREKKIELS